MTIDLKVPEFILKKMKYKLPKDCICEACGEEKANLPIWNPNVLPGNDEEVPGHIWNVCKGCKRAVEEGMVIALKMQYGAILRDFEEYKGMGS